MRRNQDGDHDFPVERATEPEQLDILCVDDDPDIRTIVAVALGLDPHIEVRLAADDEEALGLLTDDSYQPNCIILDLRLADNDGKLLMGEIRCLPRFAGTPIIFLTASVGDRDKAEIQSLGAVGVIAKPFDPLSLVPQIRSLLKKSCRPTAGAGGIAR